MERNAFEDEKVGELVGICKLCGGKLFLHSTPLWDAPGDCAPLIDSWNYYVWCSKCFVSTQPIRNSVDDALVQAQVLIKKKTNEIQ